MQKIVKAINECVSLYSKKQYQAVVTKLPSLLSKIPYNGQLIYILAMSERFTGHNEKSEHYFNLLITKTPENCAYLCGYANLLITMGRYTNAQQIFERSLIINDKYFDANYNLARLFTLQKKFEQASRLYQASIGIEPFNQSAYLGLIDCQSKLMKQETAISTCLTFIANNKNNNKIKHKLALLYKDMGEVTLCINAYERYSIYNATVA